LPGTGEFFADDEERAAAVLLLVARGFGDFAAAAAATGAAIFAFMGLIIAPVPAPAAGCEPLRCVGDSEWMLAESTSEPRVESPDIS
jgi:hypothetical protein